MMDDKTRHKFMRAVCIERSAESCLMRAIKNGNRHLAFRAAHIVQVAHKRSDVLSRASVSIYTDH